MYLHFLLSVLIFVGLFWFLWNTVIAKVIFNNFLGQEGEEETDTEDSKENQSEEK